jgi:hypothetical protein
MIAIDQMTPGAPPTGFVFARTGRGGATEWIVVDDKPTTAGRAIEQTSTDRTDYRFPLAICGSVSAANLDARLRFKAVSGKVDQAGGIAVRLQDADNFYVVRANALEDNVRFYKTLFSVVDQTFAEAGAVALWTKADSVTRFDQIRITVLP